MKLIVEVPVALCRDRKWTREELRAAEKALKKAVKDAMKDAVVEHWGFAIDLRSVRARMQA